MKNSRVLFMFLILGAVSAAMAQNQPADNMEILADKIGANKKLLVAVNMGLTESQAAVFWSVYDAYQKELAAINTRIGNLIDEYAAAYVDGSLDDATAGSLIEEMVQLELAEAEMKKSYVPKLDAVLPTIKVARYLQIENKIRAVVKYEFAAQVPLVE